MKKILLVLVCSLFAFETVSAQGKNAVGLRLGDGVEFLYQCDLSSRNFLQFTLATPHFEGLSVTGIYNWRCCRWNWTPQTCDWYLNVGVGGALGLYDFDDSGFLLGVAGSCAFGCHFKNAPISLEVDYRPVIGAVIGGGHDGFFDPGFWNFGLSVKFYVYFYLYYIITSFPLGVRDKGANGHFKSQIFNTQIIDNISTNHKNGLRFAPAAIYY